MPLRVAAGSSIAAITCGRSDLGADVLEGRHRGADARHRPPRGLGVGPLERGHAAATLEHLEAGRRRASPRPRPGRAMPLVRRMPCQVVGGGVGGEGLKHGPQVEVTLAPEADRDRPAGPEHP